MFLKNTYYALIHKKRKKNASFGFLGHIQGRFRLFPAYFGLFRPFSGLFRLYRPYRPPADMTWYGRYGPILAESARFGANRSWFGTNRAESERIREKKKKNADAVRRAGNRIGRHDPRRAESDAGAAPLVPRPCFLASTMITTKESVVENPELSLVPPPPSEPADSHLSLTLSSRSKNSSPSPSLPSTNTSFVLCLSDLPQTTPFPKPPPPPVPP